MGLFRTVLCTVWGLCYMQIQVSTMPVTEGSVPAVLPEIETIKLDEIVDTAVTKLELHEQQIQQIQQDIIHIADVLENQSFDIKRLQDFLVPRSNEPTDKQKDVLQENVAHNTIQAPNEQSSVNNGGQNQATSELESPERSQELESQESKEIIESMENLEEAMSPELESSESVESIDNMDGVKEDSPLFEPEFNSLKSIDNLEKGEYSYY